VSGLATLGLGAFADAGWGAWAVLFGHFVVLSFVAVGGAIAAAPDMHRVAVEQHGWLTDAQFSASIALAQAAPGPNVLFVAVIGYHVAGLAGAFVALGGMLLPSTLLAVAAGRYGARRHDSRGVRAFVAGLAPVTVGLIAASAWILIEPMWLHPGALLLVAGTVWVMMRRKVSPLWLIGAGAVVGALGGA
jgi:chromate transporter